MNVVQEGKKYFGIMKSTFVSASVRSKVSRRACVVCSKLHCPS